MKAWKEHSESKGILLWRDFPWEWWLEIDTLPIQMWKVFIDLIFHKTAFCGPYGQAVQGGPCWKSISKCLLFCLRDFELPNLWWFHSTPWQTLLSSVRISEQIASLTLLLGFFGVPHLGLQPSLSMVQHSQPVHSHLSPQALNLCSLPSPATGQVNTCSIRVHILVFKTFYWKLNTSEKAIFKRAISLMCLHLHLSGVRVVPV